MSILANSQRAQNGYEPHRTRNGQQFPQPFLAQQDMAKGDGLNFTMSVRPKKHQVSS